MNYQKCSLKRQSHNPFEVVSDQKNLVLRKYHMAVLQNK